ncbi:MAG: hypothetical protein GY877_06575 [Hyphomicrobium sp.]|nr:hypothetical protein [Hyphomicrobium sp.]
MGTFGETVLGGMAVAALVGMFHWARRYPKSYGSGAWIIFAACCAVAAALIGWSSGVERAAAETNSFAVTQDVRDAIRSLKPATWVI